jgi:hypothetical protein
MIKINVKFIILLLISIIYALAGGGNLPYYILYSLLLLLILSYVHILIIKHFLEVKVVFKREYYSSGDQAECITKINCDALIPLPYVEVRSDAFINSDTNYIGEMCNITLEENRWIYSNVNFISRGIYDLGKIRLRVMDLFQIVTLYKDVDTDVKVKVYPRIYNLKITFYGGKDIFLESLDKNGTNEDQFQIKDVRKYRQGDSLKKIHWKVSAKHRELYVKNSESISGEETSLFIDMSKDNFTYNDKGAMEELVIDMAVSIIRFFRLRDMNVKVSLNTASQTSFNINSRESFNSLLDFLVQQKSDGIMKIEDYIHENCYRIHRMTKIMVVTAALKEEFLKNIIALKTAGYSVSVFYCSQESESKAKEHVLKKWGIECLSAKNILRSMEV